MAATDVWTYRDSTGTATDISGFDVDAVDGRIGKIDEATYDVGSSYIVVDTGPWIFGKKVMLPGGVIEFIDSDKERVYVNRTKSEIKSAPKLDQGDHQDSDQRAKLDGHQHDFPR